MESANFLSAARDPSLREDLLLSIVYDPGRLATRIDDETIHEILCSVTREQHKHREFVFLILSLAQKRSTIIDIISRLLSPKRQQRKEQDIYEEVITYYLDTQHTTSDGDFTILGEKLVAHGQLPLVVKYIIPQFVQAVNSYRVPEKKLHDTCKRIETIYFALYEWEKKESLVEPILCLCKADPRMRQFLCTNIVNRIDKEKPKIKLPGVYLSIRDKSPHKNIVSSNQHVIEEEDGDEDEDEDHYHYQLRKEMDSRYMSTYSEFKSKQITTNDKHYSILVEWILELSYYYAGKEADKRYNAERVFQDTMHYINKYISTVAAGSQILQLIGCTCFLLATKMASSEYHVSISDLVYISDNTFSHEELKLSEIEIAHKLQMYLNDPPTIYTFTVYYLKKLLSNHYDDHTLQRITQLACYIQRSAILKPEYMTFRRSCLAISSIYVALVTLQYNSNLNRDDVIPSSIIAVDNQIPQQLLDYYTKQRLLTDYSELQRCILALSRDFTIRLNAKQEPSPAVPIDVLDAIHVFVRGLEPIQYGMIKSLVYRDDDENKN